MSKRQLSEARKRNSKVGSALSLPIYYLSVGINVAVILVMIYGVLGEILALLALEQRQAMLSTQSSVMQSAVILIVAAAVASAWRVVEAAFRKAETQSDGAVTQRESPITQPPDE